MISDRPASECTANRTPTPRAARNVVKGEIEADTIPKVLSEDVIRMISAKKNEPGFMLEWRLNLFIHHRQAEDLAEEVDHLFGPGQPVQVAVDDDAVEAVWYNCSPPSISERPR